MIALLKWLEPGNRTREQAKKWETKADWVMAIGLGMFIITKEGTLLLTEKGAAELSLARTMA